MNGRIVKIAYKLASTVGLKCSNSVSHEIITKNLLSFIFLKLFDKLKSGLQMDFWGLFLLDKIKIYWTLRLSKNNYKTIGNIKSLDSFYKFEALYYFVSLYPIHKVKN